MIKYLNMEKVTPKFEFKHFSTAFSLKGLYTMETFETSIKQMFQDAGLDIQGKKLSDAKMPLYIIASNITKGVPTIFSKDISVIDALKCSCCIPGVFRPIELYGQIYIDGNLFAPCIASLIPKDALVLTLLKQRKRHLIPELIETMSPIAYLDELYIMTSGLFHNACLTPNTLCLSYPNLHSDSNLNDFDIQKVLENAGKSFNEFISKRLL